MRTRLVPADGDMPAPAAVEGFGRCLLQAVRGMLAEGHAAACVLSSDIPTLPTRLLVQAARILLVPGTGPCSAPATTAATTSSASSRPMPACSPTSPGAPTPSRAATRARAREIGLELVELEPWYDVDDAVSLTRLSAESAGYAAPATRAVLARLSEPVPA